MTDPAPGVGHDKTREHGHAEETGAGAASGPGVSKPVPSGAGVGDKGHNNDGRGEHDDAIEETTEATDNDDGDDDEEDEEEEEEDDDEEDEDEDEEDEEPRLKYARLTQHLGGVYRNADATSSFLVAGDKMVVGTHNGNIVRPFICSIIFQPTANHTTACHTTACLPVPASVPCPLRIRYEYLNISLPAAPESN